MRIIRTALSARTHLPRVGLGLAARPGLLPDTSLTPCGDNRTLALTARSASLCHGRSVPSGMTSDLPLMPRTGRISQGALLSASGLLIATSESRTHTHRGSSEPVEARNDMARVGVGRHGLSIVAAASQSWFSKIRTLAVPRPWRPVPRSGGPQAEHPPDPSDRQRANVAPGPVSCTTTPQRPHRARAATDNRVERVQSDPVNTWGQRKHGTSSLAGIFQRILGRCFRRS